MEEIYRIGSGRKLRVRFFQLLMFAFAVWFFFWGYDLSQSFGMAPGDGASLRPLWQRLSWGVALWIIGSTAIVSAHAYVHRYVSRIQFEPSLGRVWVTTLAGEGVKASMQELTFSWREGASTHLRANGIMLFVHAPWWEMRVHGRRGAFIVDARGATIDEGLFARLRSGR